MNDGWPERSVHYSDRSLSRTRSHLSPLLPRMWELRANLTPYDAAYIALAELTGGVLLTGDERIAAAPGASCPIHIVK